ncbi:MAG: hypothetical protein EOO24_58560 [Comamonadaceae bacterium]|nr:MAG: hypothetical protein EOO24_58560 [Comamonadaceae bacterium]
MSHRAAATVALLLLAATSAAQAQGPVYRCAHRPLYTDKPCHGAEPVDTRSNLLDAGPRGFPPQPVPQQQLTILPETKPAPLGTGSSVFSDRDARDAAARARTGPF